MPDVSYQPGVPEPPERPERPVTELGMTASDKAWTAVLLGGGGLALLLVAPWLADWLDEVPFVPFSGALEWVGDLDEPLAWVLRPLAGLILGLGFAAVVVLDEHRLLVGDDAVVVVHGQDRRRLARESVVGIHVDKKKIIIDGDHGRVLFDKTVDAPRERVREAFVSRGYPFESE